MSNVYFVKIIRHKILPAIEYYLSLPCILTTAFQYGYDTKLGAHCL